MVDAVRQVEDLLASPPRGDRRRSGSRAGRRTTATSSRSAPSCSIVRTKFFDVAPNSHETANDPRLLAGCRLAVQLRPAVRRERRRCVGLDVRLALEPVEDVVGRPHDERSTELRSVLDTADVHGSRALRVILGAVDVRPRSRVEDKVGLRDPPERDESRPTPHASGHAPGELVEQRVPELAACARDDDAAVLSRSERIGDCVLQRCRTRESSHGTPRSSGSLRVVLLGDEVTEQAVRERLVAVRERARARRSPPGSRRRCPRCTSRRSRGRERQRAPFPRGRRRDRPGHARGSAARG